MRDVGGWLTRAAVDRSQSDFIYVGGDGVDDVG